MNEFKERYIEWELLLTYHDWVKDGWRKQTPFRPNSDSKAKPAFKPVGGTQYLTFRLSLMEDKNINF